jgi:hypothetical protein
MQLEQIKQKYLRIFLKVNQKEQYSGWSRLRGFEECTEQFMRAESEETEAVSK